MEASSLVTSYPVQDAVEITVLWCEAVVLNPILRAMAAATPMRPLLSSNSSTVALSGHRVYLVKYERWGQLQRLRTSPGVDR